MMCRTFKQLPFVFMDSLGLDVKQGVGVDFDPAWCRGYGAKPLLIGRLTCEEILLKSPSPAYGSSSPQTSEVGDPGVADGLGDQFGQAGIGI